MNRTRRALRAGAVAILGMLVAALLIIIGIGAISRAHAAKILTNEEAVAVCRQMCDGDNIVHVEKAIFLRMLEDQKRALLRADEAEEQAEAAIKERDLERAKPRCGA